MNRTSLNFSLQKTPSGEWLCTPDYSTWEVETVRLRISSPVLAGSQPGLHEIIVFERKEKSSSKKLQTENRFLIRLYLESEKKNKSSKLNKNKDKSIGQVALAAHDYIRATGEAEGNLQIEHVTSISQTKAKGGWLE